MKRMLEGGALRAVAVALLAFFSSLLAGAAPGSAYTLAYTGKVTQVTNNSIFQALGIVNDDLVSGTLTVDPLNTVPDSLASGGGHFPQAPLSFSYTFNMAHPGAVGGAFSLSDVSGGAIDTAGTPVTGLRFGTTGLRSELVLRFETDPTGVPLLSLAGLPSTATGLIAFLGGSSPHASGSFSLIGFGFGTVGFSIDFATAVTPIPAALPLFVSALGGLGFLSWRRRGAQRTAGTTA